MTASAYREKHLTLGRVLIKYVRVGAPRRKRSRTGLLRASQVRVGAFPRIIGSWPESNDDRTCRDILGCSPISAWRKEQWLEGDCVAAQGGEKLLGAQKTTPVGQHNDGVKIALLLDGLCGFSLRGKNFLNIVWPVRSGRRIYGNLAASTFSLYLEI